MFPNQPFADHVNQPFRDSIFISKSNLASPYFGGRKDFPNLLFGKFGGANLFAAHNAFRHRVSAIPLAGSAAPMPHCVGGIFFWRSPIQIVSFVVALIPVPVRAVWFLKRLRAVERSANWGHGGAKGEGRGEREPA